MAKLTAEPVLVGIGGGASSSTSSSSGTKSKWGGGGGGGLRSTSHSQSQLISLTIRASQSMEDKNRVYKELGLFSLKKKIDDAVYRAEMLAPALELEEAKQIKQEEMLREYNLWDDAAKSNEILSELADSTRAVHALKDLQYKAEEAKLITQLATMDVINYRLFKQAYNASIDVSKFLDGYEMSKLLSGPYDMEGACVIIRAGSKGVNPKVWAEQLLDMYLNWGAKQGYKGRVVDKYPSKGGGIKLAAVEFESKYAYGYLSGERGVHRMVTSLHDESTLIETTSASIDVIPLFLQATSDLQIADEDMMISSISSPSGKDKLHSRTETAVRILHIPTGISVQSSDERNRFANKIKALNRLKAKLLVIAMEQGVSSVRNINKVAITDICSEETRRYFIHPSFKLVQDMKTGIELPDLNSVLDGNIEPLIGANISIRHTDYYGDDTTIQDG